MSVLTIEDIQKAIDLICPILYYSVDKNIEKGCAYLCKETEFCPEFIVCNPDDFEVLKIGIGQTRRLVHLKDEPKENQLKRIKKHFGILAGLE